MRAMQLGSLGSRLAGVPCERRCTRRQSGAAVLRRRGPAAFIDFIDLLEPVLRAQDALSQLPSDTLLSLLASSVAVTGGAARTLREETKQRDTMATLRAARRRSGLAGLKLAGLRRPALQAGGGGMPPAGGGGGDGGGGGGGDKSEDAQLDRKSVV